MVPTVYFWWYVEQLTRGSAMVQRLQVGTRFSRRKPRAEKRRGFGRLWFLSTKGPPFALQETMYKSNPFDPTVSDRICGSESQIFGLNSPLPYQLDAMSLPAGMPNGTGSAFVQRLNTTMIDYVNPSFLETFQSRVINWNKNKKLQ